MPSLELIVAASIVVALNLYMLLGGADYGGGVWDLLASGPRASEQRNLIARAIGPVWEANHVWLILAITVLFTAFPEAFATIASVLHLPILLMLIGIVFRGCAFAFRSHDTHDDGAQAKWSLVFSVSSLLTPILLGTTLGSIASGRVFEGGSTFASVYVQTWLSAFPLAVGIFALALFAFLAAVYLTIESTAPLLREDFRRRALWAGVLVAIMAVVVFVLAGSGAPQLRESFAGKGWIWPLQVATGLAAILTFVGLYRRTYRMARVAVIIQSSLILWGWALAQFPNLIMPDLSLYDTQTPRATLVLLVTALAVGAAIVIPAFVYLLRIFKGRSYSPR
jgi:cytochrome bd ubiquinol oxidase subunit II